MKVNSKMMMSKGGEKIGGFTLVELMVSLTIFSITILISVGTLLVMIDANAKAQALYSATTNLSFALDSLTREFRTGYNYFCVKSTGLEPRADINEDDEQEDQIKEGDDCNFLAFTRQRDNFRVGYRFNPECHEGDHVWACIEQRVEDFHFGTDAGDTDRDGGDGWIPITSSDVTVDGFSVDVKNADPYSSGDELQPVSTIRVWGHVTNGLETDTDFNIQTRIVQRVLDVR